jgi:hypothetical protein
MKTTILPGRDDMERRLLAVKVVTGSQHVQQKFVPLLLQEAGRQIDGPGVVMMLQLAFEEYTDSVVMPDYLFAELQKHLKDFVEALIDDEEVKTDAITMIEGINA